MNTKTKTKNDDYDSPWKEILEQYFKEFIEFFFPEAYIDIDWIREFLINKIPVNTPGNKSPGYKLNRPKGRWFISSRL